MLTQKQLNQRYWSEYTAKASEFYKRKMFELVAQGEDYSEPLAIARLEGTLHGEPTPHHWMFRLLPLSVPGHPEMHYEFLIEYDIFEPHVGIYYGCKCITAPGADHDEAIHISNKHWEEVRPVVTTVLNNVFIDLDFTQRFKVTNNAENNTYWPFWISLYEDEDIIKIGREALNLIRDIYDRYLSGKLLSSPKKLMKDKEVRTRFTQTDYDSLLSDWNDIFSGMNITPTEKPAEIFDEFIRRGVEKGWFIPEPVYGHKSRVYRFNVWAVYDGKKDCSYFFPKMIRALKECIVSETLSEEDRVRYHKYTKGKKVGGGTPWRALTRIFLNSEGRLFEENILRNSIREVKAKGGPDWQKLIQELMGERSYRDFSTFARDCILNTQIVERLSQEQMRILNQLIREGNNLNQIAKACNCG